MGGMDMEQLKTQFYLKDFINVKMQNADGEYQDLNITSCIRWFYLSFN